VSERVGKEQWSLPGYRIGPVLGRGGFAIVYRAEQVSLGRDVAVKVLTTDLSSEGDLRRFERERQALVRLSPHPHVVDVIDAGVTAERRPFVVMRHYPGGTLAQRAALHGPLPVAETVQVVSKIADALDAAHALGVVHGDVKPQNVLLDERGEPVLADFGIARLLDASREDHHTSTVFFTPAHVAPEVLQRRRAGVASDVYSLASTTYQLLAGRPAFDPEDPRIATHILDSPPPPIARPEVSAELADFVVGAMAKDPAARPATAGAFATGLATLLAAQLAADQATTLLPTWPTRREPAASTPREPAASTPRDPAASTPPDPAVSTSLDPGPGPGPAPDPGRRARRRLLRPVGAALALGLVTATIGWVATHWDPAKSPASADNRVTAGRTLPAVVDAADATRSVPATTTGTAPTTSTTPSTPVTRSTGTAGRSTPTPRRSVRARRHRPAPRPSRGT
jgi:serine/threonine-protein kinase PknK